MLLGIPFGITFDLTVGQLLGVFNYEIGFSLLFLLVNGVFSYGVMMATVSFLSIKSFFSFYTSATAIGVIYELTNFLSPVWSWEFVGGFVFQELFVIFVAYCGLALLMKLFFNLMTSQKLLNDGG